MDIPVQQIGIILASSAVLFTMLVFLSRHSRRRREIGQPIKWGGLAAIAIVAGLVLNMMLSAYWGSDTEVPEGKAEFALGAVEDGR